MLNRRNFLKMIALSTFGMCLNPLETQANQRGFDEPMIYKRNLKFSDYEERTGTDFIVIHHTGFINPLTKEPLDRDNNAEEIHKFHIEENGWAGIGYHYLIRKDGMIEQGRLPNMVGAHVFQYNQKSIGVSLAGNFTEAEPTEAQMQSVKALTAWLCQEYKLDPFKKGVIVGHRDIGKTTCPGDNLYCRLDEIREYCREF